jgi:chromosome segregation ATPase
MPTTPVAAEVLHQAGRSGAQVAAPAKEDDDKKISVFWRVFGGTLLSIAALVVVTVYQQFSNTINDLRGDLSHLNADLRKEMSRLGEVQGELVTREDFAGKQRYIWESIKELQGDRNTLTSLKERSGVLLDLHKASEDDRKQLTRELQQVREQKAGEEERRQLMQELQSLRERLANLEGKATTVSAPVSAPHSMGIAEE